MTRPVLGSPPPLALLQRLARQALGGAPLGPAELRVLAGAAAGMPAVCGTSADDHDPGNNPLNASQWPAERQVRSELVEWLCKDKQAKGLIPDTGVQIYGADMVGPARGGPVDLSYVNVPFQIELRHCRIRNGLRLDKARLQELDLKGCLTYGLSADRANVEHYVWLSDGFRSIGQVWLVGAHIGADLDCSGGAIDVEAASSVFAPWKNTALNARGIVVGGNVFCIRGFSARGTVRLPRSQVDGSVYFEGAKLSALAARGPDRNEADYALNLSNTSIKGDVVLTQGLVALGTVTLQLAHIGGALRLGGANFLDAEVDLTDCTAAALEDAGLDRQAVAVGGAAPTVWPRAGCLLLDGFAYGRISSPGTLDVRRRIRWLERQPGKPFRPRPYVQLAKVLRESGDADGALEVLRAMEANRRAADDDTVAAGLQSRILDWSIGYGYFPTRAIWELLGLSALGWIVYRRAYRSGHMVPIDKDAYAVFAEKGQLPSHHVPFSALVYSIESSLPLVKLGQRDRWQPHARPVRASGAFARPSAEGVGKRDEPVARSAGGPAPGTHGRTWRWLRWLRHFRPGGRFVTGFLWFQVMLGWLLATLFVAGISGAIKKD